uniref:Uncharacterized protein n=1 Tax=Arundo donax TaxID=35708 RepID=A0A0A9FMX7_ARUDO
MVINKIIHSRSWFLWRRLRVQSYPQHHRTPQVFSYAISPRRHLGVQVYLQRHRTLQKQCSRWHSLILLFSLKNCHALLETFT